jgi:hypothetical protein
LYAYYLWNSYYNSTVYFPAADGGQREYINSALGRPQATVLDSLYNPVYKAVSLYKHVLRDIEVVTDNDNLYVAISNIWEWSNFKLTKEVLCTLTALYGNCGIRIVAENSDQEKDKKVYLKIEHPSNIRDLELDSRGNVKQILLEYTETEGIDEDAEEKTYREYMSQEEFIIWDVSSGNAVEIERYDNLLGFVPYVLVTHENTGNKWGLNCFYRNISLLNRINELASHINEQISKHIRATWIIAASGKPPQEIDLSGQKTIYVNTSSNIAGGNTDFSIEPMVAPLNLGDAILQLQGLVAQLEDNMPELKAVSGKYLSGQSGETVLQLRKPAEDLVAVARNNYEDALIRANKMAVSWGIALGLFNIGTGTGSVDAAQRAFAEDYENHSFNERDILPRTIEEKLAYASAVGDFVSDRERLRLCGYTDERIELIEQEKMLEQEGYNNAVVG